MADISAWLERNGQPGRTFDIVMEGETPPDDPRAAREIVGPWADAGATSWLDALVTPPPPRRPHAQDRERMRAGPPA